MSEGEVRNYRFRAIPVDMESKRQWDRRSICEKVNAASAFAREAGWI